MVIKKKTTVQNALVIKIMLLEPNYFEIQVLLCVGYVIRLIQKNNGYNILLKFLTVDKNKKYPLFVLTS